MVAKPTQFPIVDALLLTPEEGNEGFVGICTNTSAAGQVLNEIEEPLRTSVSVLGSLIVSRDGAERMILNSLAHPTLTYLILFSEEAFTFAPSTNLLQALMHGIDTSNSGNYIVNGKAASAHYPNLSKHIVDTFRDNITVLPLFMYKNDFSAAIVEEYLDWLKPNISQEVHELLVAANSKKKIYYDTLNELVRLLSEAEVPAKASVELDPKEFQHLQPPKIAVSATEIQPTVPFHVHIEDGVLRVDIEVGEKKLTFSGKDEFLLEYSIMHALGEDRKLLSPLEQLLLGAEIGRVGIELANKISLNPFITPTEIANTTPLPLESKLDMTPDQKYYYKISVKESDISVMCLAFDVCEEVFELRSQKAGGIFEWLSENNRFEDYNQDFLHRMDVGNQIGRAAVAADHGYDFIQDFATIFKINRECLPLVHADGDNFLDVHKQVLTKIYTEGLTEEHGDPWKGLARTAAVLAIYRNADQALKTLPAIYRQGEQTTEEMREAYKSQFLRFDSDGDYSYGERTRSFFGLDQLPHTIECLKKNPERAAIIGRFDPTKDMGSHTDKDTGELKYTKDPCLTHDIFFMHKGTLNSFHIARAHNTVNAYPENIFGLYDAYVSTIRDGLKKPMGDMYMLSSRANILLLTEEQRTKKILAEPSKPAHDLDTTSGPYLLGENVKSVEHKNGVAYTTTPLAHVTARPESTFLDCLENFEDVNVIERAIGYLKQKGVMHNNPVFGTHHPGKTDAQDDHLAFFQANVFGGKVHATAVFTNHNLDDMKKDKKMLNYLATLHSKELGYPLGDLSLFYVGCKAS